MSSSQCCYVRQNMERYARTVVLYVLTVLSQCVFKVSAFGFNACTKTCAPMSDCWICCNNNALIRVTSVRYSSY